MKEFFIELITSIATGLGEKIGEHLAYKIPYYFLFWRANFFKKDKDDPREEQ